MSVIKGSDMKCSDAKWSEMKWCEVWWSGVMGNVGMLSELAGVMWSVVSSKWSEGREVNCGKVREKTDIRG
jgi:hypothetical protein